MENSSELTNANTFTASRAMADREHEVALEHEHVPPRAQPIRRPGATSRPPEDSTRPPELIPPGASSHDDRRQLSLASVSRRPSTRRRWRPRAALDAVFLAAVAVALALLLAGDFLAVFLAVAVVFLAVFFAWVDGRLRLGGGGLRRRRGRLGRLLAADPADEGLAALDQVAVGVGRGVDVRSAPAPWRGRPWPRPGAPRRGPRRRAAGLGVLAEGLDAGVDLRLRSALGCE